MSTPILLPRMGASMTHAVFIEWLVPDGSAVTEGDELYIVGTDKVDQTVEATATGTLRTEAQPDQEFAIGEQLGEIV
ncbi:lipoyl domain-containing protein [Sporichthya sp.]|uniref:lipoyl domain-containing protein n=1 Tax=Sporichthya sp. TaxID=65475 RepID=UPI0017C1BEDC|nr:lipoyl domain-containing protein [Sporichthya sp.]MBA3743126.1 dihydrolipoamide acyltransferase [Sporichthya sp.]